MLTIVSASIEKIGHGFIFGRHDKPANKVDPYVIVRVPGHLFRNQEHKTPDLKNTSTPQWNAQFLLKVTNRDVIEFLIKDHDTFTPDDLIGKVGISVQRLMEYIQQTGSNYQVLIFQSKYYRGELLINANFNNGLGYLPAANYPITPSMPYVNPQVPYGPQVPAFNSPGYIPPAYSSGYGSNYYQNPGSYGTYGTYGTYGAAPIQGVDITVY